MKRFLSITWVFICISYFAHGQSCPQTLRLARSIYEQGRLHELPPLLEKCLSTPDGFTKSEKVDAYRLLTLAYIYLEEPDKADEHMLKLIQTDHYFKPNEAVEPAEFIALYRTFRTRPIFRVGGKAGLTVSEPNTASLQKSNQGTAEYNRGLDFAFGASFELPWKDRFTLNPELFYSSQSFDYSNVAVTDAGNFSTDATIGLNYISLPLMVQYRIKKQEETLLNPYVSAGVTPEYMLSASNTPGRKLAGNQPIETKTYTTTSQFEKFNLSATVAAGIKMRFGGGFVLAELRFKYGLLNVNNPSNSFSIPDIAWNYHYVDGIYKLNSLQFSVGYVHNIFSPKKLTVKSVKK